jgi:hypothetical protein
LNAFPRLDRKPDPPGVFRDVEELINAIEEYIARHHEAQTLNALHF